MRPAASIANPSAFLIPVAKRAAGENAGFVWFAS
jgi:hypothetical protein